MINPIQDINKPSSPYPSHTLLSNEDDIFICISFCASSVSKPRGEGASDGGGRGGGGKRVNC